MKNVKLPSGFVKVERTEEERWKSFSVNDEFMREVKRNIHSKPMANAIDRAYKKAKGEEE